MAKLNMKFLLISVICIQFVPPTLQQSTNSTSTEKPNVETEIIKPNQNETETISVTITSSVNQKSENETLPLSQIESCPSTTLQQNKDLVKTFYQKALGDKNVTNIEEFLLPTYIQHNPRVADGIEGFLELFKGPFGQSPKTVIDFKKVSAEDDFVWLHLKGDHGDTIYAVVDIFRIECGKIAEHWDVLQPITTAVLESAKNPHPFF